MRFTIFQDSRLALIDQVAGVQKQEAMLEPLVEADSPDETQVLAQIDKVAQARAELEKTHARMLLSIRQVLSQEQWKKLKSEMPRPGMRSMRIGGGVQGMRMRQPRSPNAPPQAPPPDQPE